MILNFMKKIVTYLFFRQSYYVYNLNDDNVILIACVIEETKICYKDFVDGLVKSSYFSNFGYGQKEY